MELNDNVMLYWLSLAGASLKKMNAVLEVYSPFQIWDSLGKDGELSRVLGERNYAALLRFKNESYLEKSLENLDDQGICYIARSDKRFPEALCQREVCPPLILYYKGNVSLLNTDGVAVVGTRVCSRYGKEMAEKFSRDLATSGVTVISGLATGIDMYAHQSTLNAGGKTIAVLGSGLNRISPMSNYSLSENIVAKGLLLSEYPPNQEATRYSFPERNRIVSGLSLGVLVIEAPLGSGALITAEYAGEQGRDVFCVPGNVNSPKSIGSNELLKNGAHFVTCAQDICEFLSHSFHTVGKKNTSIQLDIFEEKIYNLLQNGDLSFDELIVALGLGSQELSVALSTLEIYGLVLKKQANIYGVERG